MENLKLMDAILPPVRGGHSRVGLLISLLQVRVQFRPQLELLDITEGFWVLLHFNQQVRGIVFASIPVSVAHVSRQRRALTKAIDQEAVESHFDALAGTSSVENCLICPELARYRLFRMR